MTVRLTFKTPEGFNFNSWELSNYLNRIASYHYKYEALGDVLRTIEKGESIENIFVLNNSFLVDRGYKFLSDVSLRKKSIISLLNIGKIVSLVPNKTFSQINIAYDLLNLEYTFLNEDDIKRQKRTNYISDNLLKLIGDKFESNFAQKSEQLIQKVRKKEKSRIEGKIKKIINGYRSIRYFNSGDINRLDNETATHLTSEFRKRVAYLQRPVLGILTKEEKVIIAARSLIQNVEDSKTYFIIRDLNKENPVTINIDLFGDILRDLLNPEKSKLEKELLESNIDLVKQQAIKIRLENIEKVLELHSKYYNAVQTGNKVIQSYMAVQLNFLLSELQNDMARKSVRVSRGADVEIQNINLLA